MLDLRSEKDIERLRQVALLLDSQMKHLLGVLANKCAELDQLKGSDRELQLAMALLEQAKNEPGAKPTARPRRPRIAAARAAEGTRGKANHGRDTARRSNWVLSACRSSASSTTPIARAPVAAGASSR